MKLEILSDDDIYVATVHGFSKRVEATNLTDEIELKRFEGAKQVAQDQLKETARQILEIISKKYHLVARNSGDSAINEVIRELIQEIKKAGEE